MHSLSSIFHSNSSSLLTFTHRSQDGGFSTWLDGGFHHLPRAITEDSKVRLFILYPTQPH
jgi:hypothetical protein